MRSLWAKYGRYVKALLAVLIVGGVAWQFGKLLSRPELRANPLRLDPGWLLLALLSYLVAVSCWAGYWWRLVRLLGDRLSPPYAAMAYFASQLGKYVPGKALVIVLRVAMARAAGVRTGVAVMTAFYETLTAMACGALVGALLLVGLKGYRADHLWTAVVLLGVAGVPIVPPVFNWLARRSAKPFLPPDAPALPRLTFGTLLTGLAQTAVGWFLLGLSLLLLLRALRPEVADLTVVGWLTCTAYAAVAYVAGFVMLATPSGLGVREFVLQSFLAVELAPRLGDEAAPFAVVVALLLRLLWSGTELALASGCFLTYRLRRAPA